MYACFYFANEEFNKVISEWANFTIMLGQSLTRIIQLLNPEFSVWLCDCQPGFPYML